jgi:DNA-binding response OmpR family regulator
MPPKILVVDDSPLVREQVRRWLEPEGMIVVPVRTAFDLADVIQQNEPVLVLLDVSMPGLEGDSALSLLRRSSTVVCPIVLHSSKAEEELRALAQSCSADGYICKGPDRDYFLHAVRYFLDMSTQRMSRF